MKTYSKQQILEAKKGTHFVRWQPDGPSYLQVVHRVSGEHVWVIPAPNSYDPTNPDRCPVQLNRFASANLMKGDFR